MRIYVNGMWCDTKTDWGYASDEAFIAHTCFEKVRLEELSRVQKIEINTLKEHIDKLVGELVDLEEKLENRPKKKVVKTASPPK